MKVDRVLQEVEQLSGDTKPLVIAFSGGLDSTVLLHILSQSKFVERLTALHVHHGLSEHSDVWAIHCQEQCRRLGVPCEVERVVVENTGGGLEEAARDARYEVFSRYAARLQSFTESMSNESETGGICILTGHHANDQAETILFRLFRGTGIKGLAGIRRSKMLSKRAQVIRPLLEVSKVELTNYATLHELSFVEDDSNADETFDRNYIRKNILPLAQQRWPQVLDQFASLVRRASDASNLMQEYALEDLAKCGARSERIGFSLDIASFSIFSRNRQHHLLREWATTLGFDAPMPAHLEQISLLLNAGEDAKPAIEWRSSALTRFRDRLYLLPRFILRKPTISKVEGIAWDSNKPCRLPDGSLLELLTESAGRFSDQAEFAGLNIRFRQGGERCKPEERAHSQTLKKLLQEYALEPWLRYRVPLIYKNDELIAVGDLWWCSNFGFSAIKWTYGKAEK